MTRRGDVWLWGPGHPAELPAGPFAVVAAASVYTDVHLALANLRAVTTDSFVDLGIATRRDAMAADRTAVAGMASIVLTDGSGLHLVSVLQRTPLWQAIVDAHAAGTAIVAVGEAASAVCDPMTDPRGGAFTLGLGLLTKVAFVPGEIGDRTRRLTPSDVTLLGATAGQVVHLPGADTDAADPAEDG